MCFILSLQLQGFYIVQTILDLATVLEVVAAVTVENTARGKQAFCVHQKVVV